MLWRRSTHYEAKNWVMNPRLPCLPIWVNFWKALECIFVRPDTDNENADIAVAFRPLPLSVYPVAQKVLLKMPGILTACANTSSCSLRLDDFFSPVTPRPTRVINVSCCFWCLKIGLLKLLLSQKELLLYTLLLTLSSKQ